MGSIDLDLFKIAGGISSFFEHTPVEQAYEASSLAHHIV